MSPKVGIRRFAGMAAAIVAAGSATCVAAAGAAGARPTASPEAVLSTSWTTFDQNGLRTGIDPSGDSFTPARRAWTSPVLDGQLYGQPLIASGRVYAATENDTVYALAADTGAVLWSNHVGTPFSPSTVHGLCGDINPTVGITSTPVIDAARSEIFVVAAEQVPGNAAHHLIGLDMYTGAVLLDEVIDPAGVASPAFELQRASLALTDGRVIVGFGGNAGDCGTYHGLVVSAPEDGSNPSVFTVADLPGDNQGAVWMGGSAPPVDSQGDVWVATGNSADTTGSDSDASDSVLRLSPTAQLLDSFTPTTWHSDNGTDADLGSTSPALLPNGLVFQVGKLQTAYVLDQSNLGGIGGQLAETPGFCGADPDGGSADLNGTLFVPCGDGLRAVRPTDSPPTALWKTTSGAHGSPIIAGGLVWSIGGGNLYALDPTTGVAVQQFATGGSASSFPSPAAADDLIVSPDNSDRLLALEGPSGLPGPPSPPPVSPGYWLSASDGGVFAFGSAPFAGSAGSLQLVAPVVGMAPTPDHQGYWLVAADGGVFNYGDAGFYGSAGGLQLAAPVVGMAPTPDGRGYWLVGADGGVFAFGDAVYAGSTGGLHLNAPVVGMAAGRDDAGYWLVASDGGVFAFGTAPFEGSAGSIPLNRPIVGMAASPSAGTDGYWLVAADGGIFSFGSAGFHGSTGGLPLVQPVVGMAASATGDGYWLTAADGGVFAFGDAAFEGSAGGVPLNAPVVGIAAGSDS
ncbi:MAG: PQQ-binding-like beta-propeller repeat protein [Acidimicrobiales bacterium]|jgi:outer membrane protein assembly factor BamB